MVETWDGTISSTDFYVAASAFSQRWTKFNSCLPQWTWVPSCNRPWVSNDKHKEGYLSMENVLLPGSPEIVQKENCVENVECISECQDELSDDAILVHNDGPGEHRFDFHVVYSASFRVPVLFFRAYCSDGQPLLLDDIEKDISISAAEQLTKSKWTFITQEEHPHLNRPWYMLHPCATSEWMKLLSAAWIPAENFLSSWFSVVGQVFRLKIPYQMLLDIQAT
ncbi:ubiquitin-like-conjugating enzyme ATG10 isoform X1 [Andrographis paniculata]|uniref:ubiquitin-like-conjugating enzyme ATG10 isoform X1 n=1 Tax=Andrographis paniculata TaxID=175694 RepID=UPI0021E94D2C|nr:ubiquitin-like-conjugating enzyme ATG10 isoform X1 [Andrographis paniculata]XP_051142304.1 ubiquitin-like-conjugating enzyme ATG10 isoform X1 [Andrographis paniculata]XP_051142305.1 ubiquitin-like-conjugating enzyme ATG10 isoform X1 [Andrographis paniculata]XP_051142306.1 ubiquitin-like-conjugating enzyme ATG10 isoform X1 [Andrographis paniculata]XP_051142307.1 ubiquitin-like-conjugating enzyme ATG10 isoform X1 [Andrographis paniculata]